MEESFIAPLLSDSPQKRNPQRAFKEPFCQTRLNSGIATGGDTLSTGGGKCAIFRRHMIGFQNKDAKTTSAMPETERKPAKNHDHDEYFQ